MFSWMILKLGNGGGGKDGEVPVGNMSAATFLDGQVICSIFGKMLEQF